MSFSIIIPMYNESSLCEKTAQELLSAFSDAFPEEPFELIFSDDGSADDSAEKIARLAAHDTRVRLVRAPHNMGKGAAVRRGMLAATGDDMLFTDCDLAYGIAQPIALLRFHRQSGAAVTVGSRAKHKNGYAGYGALRRLFSRAFLLFCRILSGLRQSDVQTGLKCFRGDTARAVFSRATLCGFGFDTEILLLAKACGAEIKEYPVCIERSDASLGRRSRVHLFSDAFLMLRDILRAKKAVRAAKTEPRQAPRA